MKKIYKKIILLFIAVIIGVGISCIESNAASASISASSQNVNVGDKVTITASATGCLSELSISGPGVSGRIDIVNTNLENETKSATYTLDTSSAGTKTVTISGSVVDANKTEVPINKTVTITVAEKTQPVQQPTQQQPQQTQQQTEPTFTNTNTTMYTTSDCNLRSSWSTSSAATGVKKGTAVTVTGTSKQKVNGYTWYRVNYGGTKYVANFLLTSTKPADEQQKEEEKKEETTDKSTNKALKDLVVENYKLSPDFTPETTKYSVDVKGDVDKLTITPVLQDEKSKFVIEGNDNLKVGNNIIKITVTAEDGTTRIYTIAVAKTSDENTATEMLKLKDLRVSNANLQPSFSPEITNYVIETDDPSSIKADAVVATAEDSDVEVTVSESQDTDKNEKIITVMLEDKEGTRTGVYQITVKKASQNPIEAIKNVKDNKLYIILGSIIGVLIILIIVIIILLKKTSNSEDDDDFENDDELSDDYDYSLKNAIDEANTEPEQQYDDIVENSNVKSQILNSTPTEYDVFRDNDDIGKTQVFGDLDPENKTKRKGKHF